MREKSINDANMTLVFVPISNVEKAFEELLDT